MPDQPRCALRLCSSVDYMGNKRNISFWTILTCLTLAACQTARKEGYPRSKAASEYFQGVWVHKNGCKSEIIFREKDGTYTTRGIQGYPHDPPFDYMESGRWRADGNTLSERSGTVSYEPWRAYLNKLYQTKVEKVSPSEFEYKSSDGFDEHQTKVGDDRKVFEAYNLPLPRF